MAGEIAAPFGHGLLTRMGATEPVARWVFSTPDEAGQAVGRWEGPCRSLCQKVRYPDFLAQSGPQAPVPGRSPHELPWVPRISFRLTCGRESVRTSAKRSRAALLMACTEDRSSGVPQGKDIAAVSVDGQHLVDDLFARRAGLRGFVEVDDVLLAAGDELGEVVVGRTGGFVAGDDDSWAEGRDLVNAG